jgi:hypothetical protein
MKTIDTSNIFMFPNQYDNIVVLLRSLTTYIFLQRDIRRFSAIQMIPLFKEAKHISLLQDENKDFFYLEHPPSFKIKFWKTDKKSWSNHTWKNWLIEALHLLKMYPSLQKILFSFYHNEIENVFRKSNQQIKKLEEHYQDFQKEMIDSWFYMKRECEEDVTSMLQGHICAMSVIFKQITSSDVKKKIAKDIFSIVEIYAKIVERSLDNAKKMETVVMDFKKEVHKSINNYVNFVKTDKINFKWWLLSLYQFIFSCHEIPFDLRGNIIKLNMVLYFAIPVDNLPKHHYIYLNEKKVMSKGICEIHPFMRGMCANLYV